MSGGVHFTPAMFTGGEVKWTWQSMMDTVCLFRAQVSKDGALATLKLLRDKSCRIKDTHELH